MSGFLFRPSFFIPLLLLLVYSLYRRLFPRTQRLDIPWVGLRKEWFAETRCRWRNTVNFKEGLDYGYENFSLKGLPFHLATISDDRIILPASSTEWIVNQPDAVLDAKQAHKDSLQAEYTLSDPQIVRHPYHENVIRSDLVRQLGNLTMDIMDELKIGFDESWGLDTEKPKTIVVFENMMAIIARTSGRIFVGSPLCRNKAYISRTQKFAQAVPLSAFIISQFPQVLRPIIAPIVNIPHNYNISRFQQLLRPEIKSRMSKLDPESLASQPEPNDLLQWTINFGRTKVADQPIELSPNIIAGRLLVTNFAAIHTSTFTITNAIFDLVSSDPSLKYLEQLREEAESVLAENNGVWTKKGLSKMHKVDSALRESLRLSSFVSLGMVRKVIAKDGVTTPEGLHIPYGVYIGVSARGIHMDQSNYKDPAQYNAFRFVNQKDALEKTSHEEPDDNYLKRVKCAMVSTSAEYQPFGHGRHACPGRFFAANELKLLLAYLVLNYDIEPLKERPSGRWVAHVILPPTKATIQIKRRKAKA